MPAGWNLSRQAEHKIVYRGLACYTDRKSTRLNSSHLVSSYAVFCFKKEFHNQPATRTMSQNLGDWLPTQDRFVQNPLSGRRQCVIHAFFFNDTATTEIYTLSLHDALPI